MGPILTIDVVVDFRKYDGRREVHGFGARIQMWFTRNQQVGWSGIGLVPLGTVGRVSPVPHRLGDQVVANLKVRAVLDLDGARVVGRENDGIVVDRSIPAPDGDPCISVNTVLLR